ncbi:MAG: hypothetical protein RIR43_936 [Pseudomonadota bacterium]|jgi:REJ domain/PKD domain
MVSIHGSESAQPTAMNMFFRCILLLGACALSLAGCGGGGSGSCSSAALGSLGSLACSNAGSSNQSPVALITVPTSAPVGSPVVLDGSGSRDPDGQTLSFRWELVTRPVGSAAALNDGALARPSFVPDIQGSYTVRLIVSDGKADSAPATAMVTVSRANQAPLAKAGEDVTAVNGVEVVLNGTGSSDADGDLITYLWTLATRPAGSLASLTGGNSPRPSFTPDVSGNYVFSLVVRDGALGSAPSFVTVTSGAANVPPTAVVSGPSSVVLVGTRVTLDGSASVDPNGDLLRYSWRWVSRPSGSAAALGFATTARPEFVPDQPGDYVVGLTVNDGRTSSAERTLTVRVGRIATPSVSVGPGQSVLVGSTILLTGTGSSASSDINSELLAYLWELVSRPTPIPSPAPTITNAATRSAQFVPDAPGTYVFRLTVTDSVGSKSSATVTAQVATQNAPPIANAGSNRQVSVGETVILDGSGSRDANGDPLSFAWQLISKPTGTPASTAKLSPSLTAEGTTSSSIAVALTPDVPGTYVVGLRVNDGLVSSELAMAVITAKAVNQAPVAVITGTATGTVGSVMSFHGRSSTDESPELLTYQWTLVIRPATSTLVIQDSTLSLVTFKPDVAGQYVLRLVVNDGLLSSQPQQVVITVTP